MGTSEFAVPSLARLLATQTVVGVFTQPDRPAGRGRHLQLSPVKRLAVEHDLPILQPLSLKRDPSAVAALVDLKPEVVVVAAYGLILPPSVLTAAPGGAINVHASLLPRWRGAAPVHHAILAGDVETGVTIMLIDVGLDTGPILSQRTVPLPPGATTGALTAQLAVLGADLLVETLPLWLQGEITPRPQVDADAILAPRLAREDGALDWRLPAEDLARRVRAFDPWPSTFTTWGETSLKVLAAKALPAGPDVAADVGIGAAPGTVVFAAADPAVVTGAGLLRLDLVQLAGRRAMTGAAFVRGRPDVIGARLGPAPGRPA